jgi:hypothetical protein
MATEPQTAANRQRVPKSTAAGRCTRQAAIGSALHFSPPEPRRGENILHEISILQNEPKNPNLSSLNTIAIAKKFSTEPSEPKGIQTDQPTISPTHDINNTDENLEDYKFAKSNKLRHTSFTTAPSVSAEAEGRGYS